MGHKIQIDYESGEVLLYGEDKSVGAWDYFKPSDIRANAAAAQQWVSVASYGAEPGAGDVTTEIQAAFDGTPEGSTLFFPPGTYTISNTVTLDRVIDVYAYGAILDLASSAPSTSQITSVPASYGFDSTREAHAEATNKAAFVWKYAESGGGRPNKNIVAGLNVTRTAADYTASSYQYIGMYLEGVYECQIVDVEVWNFFAGIVCLGKNDEDSTPPIVRGGFFNNRMVNFRTWNCRYGLTLYTPPKDVTTPVDSDQGWCNENTFHNGRVFVGSVITGDPTFNVDEWEAIRLLWGSGNDSGNVSGPNNNYFYNVNFEATHGRKVRVEGSWNGFIGCRWEGHRAEDGPEIVPDPDFDGTPDTWTLASGTGTPPTLTSNTLQWFGASPNNGTATLSTADFLFDLIPEREYYLRYDVILNTTGVDVQVDGLYDWSGAALVLDVTTAGSFEVRAWAPDPIEDIVITFAGNGGSSTVQIDNFSVQSVPYDITIGTGPKDSTRHPNRFAYNRFEGGLYLDRILNKHGDVTTVAGPVAGGSRTGGGHPRKGIEHLGQYTYDYKNHFEGATAYWYPGPTQTRESINIQPAVTTSGGADAIAIWEPLSGDAGLGNNTTPTARALTIGAEMIQSQFLGGLRFWKDSVAQSFLAMEKDSPYRIAISTGVKVPSIIGYGTGPYELTGGSGYPSTDEEQLYGAWLCYNTSSASKLSFTIANASGKPRVGWRAAGGEPGGTPTMNYGLHTSGYLGEQVWFDDNYGSPASPEDFPYDPQNAIAMQSGGPSYYLTVWNGLRVNESEGTTGDFSVRSTVSPGQNIFFVDVSEDKAYYHGVELGTGSASMPWIDVAADYGAVGDGGITDNSTAFANAVAALPSSGGILYVPPASDYYGVDSTVTIAKSNVQVVIAAGAHVNYEIADDLQLFNFQGATGGTPRSATANITANDLDITVAAGDEAEFSIGDFVLIEDDEAPYDGSSVHRELNVVEDTSVSGTITLRYPMSDSFSTTEGTPGGITLTRVTTPIENCHVYGPGLISANNGTKTGGGYGVRFQYAMNSSVVGMRFEQCYRSCVTMLDCRSMAVKDTRTSYGTDYAGSAGYGVTTAQCTRVTVSGCDFKRHRHAVDFSYFSTNCSGIGNSAEGCASTAFSTHPNVKGILWEGNTVTGAQGYNSASGTEYGVGENTRANLMAVAPQSKNVTIRGNMLRYGSIQGIYINVNEGTEDILIEGNTIEQACMASGVRQGAISAHESTASPAGVDYPVAIRGNRIIDSGEHGIYAGLSNIIIEDNVISGSSQWGIWITPDESTALSKCIVKNNTVYDTSGAAAIAVGDSASPFVTVNDITIQGNTIWNAGNYGIFVYTEYTDGLYIRGNTIHSLNQSTTTHGMYLAQSTDASPTHGDYLVEGNHLYGDMKYGITIGVNGAVIQGNYLTNINDNVSPGATVGIGIMLRNPSGSADVTGMICRYNVIDGAESHCIRVESDPGEEVLDTTIQGNVCINSVRGINIDGAVTGTGCFIDGNILYNNSTADLDFTGGTSASEHRIGTYIDHANTRLGVGKVPGAYKLDVGGDVSIDDALYVNAAGGSLNPSFSVATSGGKMIMVNENGVAIDELLAPATSGNILQVEGLNVYNSAAAGGGARVEISKLKVDTNPLSSIVSDLIPGGAYDVGSAADPWSEGHFEALYAAGVLLTVATGTTQTVTSTTALELQTGASADVFVVDTSTPKITASAPLDATGNITTTGKLAVGTATVDGTYQALIKSDSNLKLESVTEPDPGVTGDVEMKVDKYGGLHIIPTNNGGTGIGFGTRNSVFLNSSNVPQPWWHTGSALWISYESSTSTHRIEAPTGAGNLYLNTWSSTGLVKLQVANTDYIVCDPVNNRIQVQKYLDCQDRNAADTVKYSIAVAMQRTGGVGAAPGLGTAIQWKMHNSVNAWVVAAQWENVWETATSGAEDTLFQIKLRSGGSWVNSELYVSGKYSAVGIGTATPPGHLTCHGDNANEFLVEKADGTDVFKVDTSASHIHFSHANAIDTTSAGSAITWATNLPTGPSGTQAGWVVLYVNGTKTYVPAFQ